MDSFNVILALHLTSFNQGSCYILSLYWKAPLTSSRVDTSSCAELILDHCYVLFHCCDPWQHGSFLRMCAQVHIRQRSGTRICALNSLIGCWARWNLTHALIVLSVFQYLLSALSLVWNIYSRFYLQVISVSCDSNTFSANAMFQQFHTFFICSPRLVFVQFIAFSDWRNLISPILVLTWECPIAGSST